MKLEFYAGREGITYKVETSENLNDWDGEGVVLSEPDANRYRMVWHPGGGALRFMRLVVSE